MAGLVTTFQGVGYSGTNHLCFVIPNRPVSITVMDPAAFSDPRRQLLVPTERGQFAFVPPSLPARLPLSPEVGMALSAADRAIGALDGIGSWMPNPYLLIQPFVRREAVLSSRIEGTQASLSDLVMYEAAAGAPRGGLPGDVLEVSNYVDALEFALSPDRDLPISLRLIQRLHEILMAGVRGGDQRPGEFRTIQNYIGQPGTRIEDASYIPPPPAQMLATLQALEKHLHATPQVPPLVHLAMTHYQFEAIHPFRDGNGRVGRLLIALLMVERTLISQPLLYLSAYFEANRQDYYHRLNAVSQQGDWDAWILFFLRGVSEQAADAVQRARRLIDLRTDYQRRLQGPRASSLPLKLVDHLFLSPIITVVGAQKHLEVTYRAAALIVDKLIAAGILEPYDDSERSRPFFAREMLEMLEGPLERQPGPEQITLELG